jgi:cell wall-associated NlpC family hydrolase
MRSATTSSYRCAIAGTINISMIVLCLLPFAARADELSAEAAGPAPASTPLPATTATSARVPRLVESVSSSVQSAASEVLRSAQDVTDQALELIGVRYRFGGQTPENGLDCSGLVRYVFEQVTGVVLPRSAREQAKVGEQVERDALQPGDLVFFNTRRAAFSHVGIYLGDNEFVHAPRRKSSVRIANIDARYWKKRFNGARRLIGIMPGVISIEAAKSLLGNLPRSDGAPDDQP